MLRQAAIALSTGRLALGIGLLAAPRPIAAGWIGEVAERPEAQALARAVGIRDVALGAGAAAALLAENDSAPAWLAGAAASDLADLAATLAAREHLPGAGVATTVALAGCSAAVCALAALEEAR